MIGIMRKSFVPDANTSVSREKHGKFQSCDLRDFFIQHRVALMNYGYMRNMIRIRGSWVFRISHGHDAVAGLNFWRWLNASSAIVPLEIKGGNLCESEKLCIRVGGVNLEGHVC